MSGSINKVILVGNLGRDPEVRLTQEGNKVLTLSVATSEQWKDRTTEERKERVEWHRVVVFNTRLAEFAERFLKKGQRVYIEGQLQNRKWVDPQGQEQRTQEIVLRFKGDIVILDSRNGGEGGGHGGGGGHGRQDGGQQGGFQDLGGGPVGDMDDEIPF